MSTRAGAAPFCRAELDARIAMHREADRRCETEAAKCPKCGGDVQECSEFRLIKTEEELAVAKKLIEDLKETNIRAGIQIQLLEEKMSQISTDTNSQIASLEERVTKLEGKF